MYWIIINSLNFNKPVSIMKMRSKLMALVALALLVAGQALAQEQKPQKIGTLNMDYVLAMMPEIKSIQSSLSTLQTQLQKQGEAKQKQYQQLVVKYQTEGPTMTLADRQQLERDIAALEEELNQFTTTAQEKLSAKQAELMGPINERVQEALKAIVAEEGYTHIFNIGVPQAGLEILFYIDPAYDVSNLVLKKMGIEPPADSQN